MTESNSYNVRELSYKILYCVLYDNKLLNIAFDDVLSLYDISDEDRSYIRRECAGVIENLTYIDEEIQKYTLFNIKKIQKEVKIILRIGMYELLYMDKVPSYATINECVELTKRIVKKFSKYYINQHRYVNAVLRKIDKEAGKVSTNYPDKMAVSKYCYFRIYNDNEALVLNELREKKLDYKIYSGALNFKYSKVYSLDNYKDIIELDNFKDGNILISDASSIYLTDALSYYIKEREKRIKSENQNVVSMMKLLDTCASPGGKILNLIDIIYNDYYYFYAEARDISDEKILKICENVNRLKVLDLNMKVKDASIYDELDKDKFDVVICDVPCSGLGVIYKKPDIKYHFNDEKLRSLVLLQKKILGTSSNYVKSGGILSYSTCTTTKEENEDIIDDFMNLNNQFKKIYEKRIEPNDENLADGFYMCFLEKI